MHQLADPDLQGEGLHDCCPQHHQQEGMDGEIMNPTADSAEPAIASTNPPPAQKPAPHIRTPAPASAAPQQLPPTPLESKRRYMIDHDDDLDLVESGAGNRQLAEAAVTQDCDPDGETEDEASSEEQEDVDLDIRFLSVTRHTTGQL